MSKTKTIQEMKPWSKYVLQTFHWTLTQAYSIAARQRTICQCFVYSWNPPKKKLVKPQRDTADSIYIMPKPEEGHGVLGTMNRNEEVTVLVEMGGYCFFVAEDGRAGWNGTKFFVDP